MNEDLRYRIEFEDGYTIEDLKLNGNVFSTDRNVPNRYFENVSYNLKVIQGSLVDTHTHARLQKVFSTDNLSFTVSDVSETAMKLDQLRADVDYIAMMTGISLN